MFNGKHSGKKIELDYDYNTVIMIGFKEGDVLIDQKRTRINRTRSNSLSCISHGNETVISSGCFKITVLDDGSVKMTVPENAQVEFVERR